MGLLNVSISGLINVSFNWLKYERINISTFTETKFGLSKYIESCIPLLKSDTPSYLIRDLNISLLVNLIADALS